MEVGTLNSKFKMHCDKKLSNISGLFQLNLGSYIILKLSLKWDHMKFTAQNEINPL